MLLTFPVQYLNYEQLQTETKEFHCFTVHFSIQ